MSATLRFCCLLLVTAALVACGRQNTDVAQNTPPRPGGSSQPQPPADNRPRMNPVVPPDMGNRGQSSVAQLKVELNEYEIRMPATLMPGRYTLTVVNSGKQNHSLVVEGNGLQAALSQQLARGDSAQLDVDFKPGTYTLSCPVDEHRGKGMSRTVTVQ